MELEAGFAGTKARHPQNPITMSSPHPPTLACSALLPIPRTSAPLRMAAASGSRARLQSRQSFRRFHQTTRRNSRSGKRRSDEEHRNPSQRELSEGLRTTLESLVDSLTSHTPHPTPPPGCFYT
ncbi:hypothetical protein NL676_012474 [Syzygium grande]|nr:hypothetical protein NL676_012474 [Syzygium grande]